MALRKAPRATGAAMMNMMRGWVTDELGVNRRSDNVGNDQVPAADGDQA